MNSGASIPLLKASARETVVSHLVPQEVRLKKANRPFAGPDHVLGYRLATPCWLASHPARHCKQRHLSEVKCAIQRQ